MTDTQQGVRSRTFEWTDPAQTAARLGRSSGLEMLRAMRDGELPTPPILHLVGGTGIEVEEGKVTVLMPAAEFHYNPLGTVHGGVIATLLDTAAGCTVHSTLPAGVGYTSLDLMTRFIRPVTIDSGSLIVLPLIAAAVGMVASLGALRRAVRVDPALAFAS